MPDGARFALEEDPQLSVKAEMNYVHYATPQYRELVTWYADLFGALPQHSGELEAATYLPGTLLNFSKTEEDKKPTENTAIDHIGFEVDDMEKFVETLQAKEVEIELGPRYIESIDLWILFFTDPSGVRIEVTEGLDGY
jgi:catechol 2,3-dioxygenase-like lactoylglutathione lyase family enzyme